VMKFMTWIAVFIHPAAIIVYVNVIAQIRRKLLSANATNAAIIGLFRVES